MSTSLAGYSVCYFDDGSREDGVPREEITEKSAGEGTSQSEQLNIGCLVVVRGTRKAVVVPSPVPSAATVTVPYGMFQKS